MQRKWSNNNSEKDETEHTGMKWQWGKLSDYYTVTSVTQVFNLEDIFIYTVDKACDALP